MTDYNTKRGALPWVSGEEFNFRYQSDYVTQGNMWGHDIYYSWQVVSENCRHGLVISAKNTFASENIFMHCFCTVILLYFFNVVYLQVQ